MPVMLLDTYSQMQALLVKQGINIYAGVGMQPDGAITDQSPTMGFPYMFHVRAFSVLSAAGPVIS